MTSECIVAVCGPVDAGKSSTIGVLTTGILDDGRGSARNQVLIHPHEKVTGRTSHITYNPLVYIKKDNMITLSNPKNGTVSPFSFATNDRLEGNYEKKVINFIDLAGHEKYLKTTIFGVTGLFPDYGIVVIGANTGITKLTK